VVEGEASVELLGCELGPLDGLEVGLLVTQLALPVLLLHPLLLLPLLLALPSHHFGVQDLLLLPPSLLPTTQQLTLSPLGIRGQFYDVFSGFGLGLLGVAVALLVLLLLNEISDHPSEFVQLLFLKVFFLIVGVRIQVCFLLSPILLGLPLLAGLDLLKEA
jgi:hypothetical protein